MDSSDGKRVISIVLALMFTMCPAWAQQDKATIGLKFEKGKKYEFWREFEQVTTGKAGGREYKSEQFIELASEIEVDEVEADGGAWLKYTYKEAKIRMRGPKGDVDFDSTKENPQTTLQTLSFALILNETFYFNIDPNGDIQKVNGLESIVSSAKGKLPNIRGKEQVLETLSKSLAESSIRGELSQFFGNWLGREMVAGESWSERQQASDESPASIESTWTIRKCENSSVTIDTKVVMMPSGDVKPITVQKIAVKRQISGEGIGSIEVDRKSGFLIRSESEQDIVEKMELANRGAYRRRQSPFAPSNIHKKIVLEVKELQ